jgi:hypothetical protein
VTEYFALIYTFTLPTRVRIFNKEVMKEYDEVHKKATKQDEAPLFGFPDTGNGFYSKKLTYSQWFDMQNG